MTRSPMAWFCLFMLAAVASPTAGVSQQAANCSDRDRILSRLSEGYGERRQSVGLGANNAVIEVYASDETGTWTILMTLPNGVSCLVATGSAFEALAAMPEPDEEA